MGSIPCFSEVAPEQKHFSKLALAYNSMKRVESNCDWERIELSVPFRVVLSASESTGEKYASLNALPPFDHPFQTVLLPVQAV